MVVEFEVGRLALYVPALDVDAHIALELPGALLEVQLAGSADVSDNADVALRQPEAAKEQHRVFAIVVGRFRIERNRQPQLIDLHLGTGDRAQQNHYAKRNSRHRTLGSGQEFAADIRLEFQAIFMQRC